MAALLPASPTPISAPGGPAFDSFVLTLDESDAVRLAVEDAKNFPHEMARLRPTANVKVSLGYEIVGAPPLVHVCEQKGGGDLKKAALLLLAGADINGTDFHRCTPLHWATMRGKVDHVRLLLAWGGADLNAIGGDHTPLYYAVNSGHVEIVRLLLLGGADANRRSFLSCYYRTPLQSAIDKGHVEIERLLREAGAVE